MNAAAVGVALSLILVVLLVLLVLVYRAGRKDALYDAARTARRWALRTENGPWSPALTHEAAIEERKDRHRRAQGGRLVALEIEAMPGGPRG